MTLAWNDIERITGGQLGRTIRSTCPFCSATRRVGNQRKPVFAVKLKEPDFAIYNCAHCGESGYVHPESSSQVIDLTERKRLREQAERREREDKQQRTAAAMKPWNERVPFRGSPAETYLRDSRGIGDWLEAFDLDESLGFHPNCPFGNEQLPCMIALIRNIVTDAPQSIHLTALTLGPRPERIHRLTYGPVRGGAIKLSLDGDVTTGLMGGEGIESTLSASKEFQFRPCWSLISKGGIAKFPALAGLECMTFAGDRDENGGGQRAVDEATERLIEAGIECLNVLPPIGVKDFNDLHRGMSS
jgi:putative DNA primase/helicase